MRNRFTIARTYRARRAALTLLLLLPLLALVGFRPAPAAPVAAGAMAGDSDPCQSLRAPEGHRAAFRLYARGVQIYRWNGASWVFVAPEAVLSADPGGRGVVGIHYGGPTWESVSGSRVVATVLERCTPDPSAIPWLLLEAVSSEGPGVFHRVTYIQRVNTAGGLAPSDPGDFPGDMARVPYTTEYVFYRAHR